MQLWLGCRVEGGPAPGLPGRGAPLHHLNTRHQNPETWGVVKVVIMVTMVITVMVVTVVTAVMVVMVMVVIVKIL